MFYYGLIPGTGEGARRRTSVAEARGRVQAEGGAALPREEQHLRRGWWGAQRRTLLHLRLGQEGRRLGGINLGQPQGR